MHPGRRTTLMLPSFQSITVNCPTSRHLLAVRSSVLFFKSVLSIPTPGLEGIVAASSLAI